MSRRGITLTALALLILAGLLWTVSRRSAEPAPGRPTDSPPSASASPDTQAASVGSPPAERSTLADPLNAANSDIHSDLRVVGELLAAFRTNFPGLGNPTGSNAEITAALTGKNKLRLALIPPEHPAINRDGELCDRWGTPFFFHAESGTRMEIRSAGPDRKMWTGDDVLFVP
jgi:hypothetical protein